MMTQIQAIRKLIGTKLFPYLILITLIHISCTGVTPISSKNSVRNTTELFDNTIDSLAKTIQLFPNEGSRHNELEPSVTPLQHQKLILTFDYLDPDFQRFYFSIIHCSYNWEPSNLQNLEYLSEYNEFPINDYEYSVDTHIPYVHYSVKIPRVKLPGNYVIRIYRGNHKEDIILEKRFMVFDDKIQFQGAQNTVVGSGKKTNLNQQLNFTLQYNAINVFNPTQDILVGIRQNQRWDNLMIPLRPTFIREDLKELEYRFFDPDKMMKGGSEFRFFDLRSLVYPGRNIDHIDRNNKPFHVFLAKDQSRRHDAYAQYNDINGNYAIENQDHPDELMANYVYTHFFLALEAPLQGKVYVTGALTQWNNSAYNQMTYDSAQRGYTKSLLLKQGWYDYAYSVVSPQLPSYYLEGSHFETENLYEIFVYHRSQQPAADLLVGYSRRQTNPR